MRRRSNYASLVLIGLTALGLTFSCSKRKPRRLGEHIHRCGWFFERHWRSADRDYIELLRAPAR
jgi:hypothetical protein